MLQKKIMKERGTFKAAILATNSQPKAGEIAKSNLEADWR